MTHQKQQHQHQHQHPVYCTFYEGKAHHYPGHPESPMRVQAMQAWIDDPPYPEIEWLDYSLADEATISLVHQQELLATLKEECRRGPREFEPSPSYVTKHSYEVALRAVGATLAVSRRIITEKTGYGFAIVRPPGHHAEPDRSMGFCLLNNIAIAAADAISSGLEKVAVLDIDAHHGNGSEAAFWDRPDAAFLSIHEENIFPGTGHKSSALHARGRIVNVPLPAFSGNDVYQSIFTRLVKPWLSQFKPEMLFVSVGYDAHFSDRLTNLLLDTSGYYALTRKLLCLAEEFCQGRMMFVLEGGYDPVALKDNIQACLAALCGHESFTDHYGKASHARQNLDSIVDAIINLHLFKEK